MCAGCLALPAHAALRVEVGPLDHDQDAWVDIAGAEPGDTVHLVQGDAVGAGDCYDFLDGDCLDLVGAVYLIGDGTADSSGEVRITLNVPEPQGSSLVFQAFTSAGFGAGHTELSPTSTATVGGGSSTAAVELPPSTGDLSAPERIIGVLDIDDDDRDGVQDGLRTFAGREYEPLDVQTTPGGSAQGIRTLRLVLDGDTSAITVWDGADQLLGGRDSSAELDWRVDPSFDVSFTSPMARGTLRIEELDASGRAVSSTSVSLLGAPILLSHHLQAAEELFMVEVDDDWGSNASMARAFERALGHRYTGVDGWRYGGDVWIQDEVEFGAITTPAGAALDVVVDGIRDRELDPWAEAEFFGPDKGLITFGSGWASSEDSFGNLETTPPLRAHGVDYPLGRIYWGHGGSRDRLPHGDLNDAFEEAGVQAPFSIDTSWLCVGHVDEYVSFVPDPSARQGFRLVVASTRVGYALIDSMSGSTRLPRYAGTNTGYGYSTVGEIQADRGLRAYNEDLQDLYIDPAIKRMMAELDLSASEVIEVPAAFHPACDDLAGALVPGLANLVVFNPVGERPVVILPDPFFRTDLDDQGDDPFIRALEQVMPSGLDLLFVDDWDVYHLAEGEVHCGTNVRRAPTTIPWWRDAAHLVGGL